MKKFKKLMMILGICAITSLSSCGWFDKLDATYTGSATICEGGVKYLQFTSGASVAYNTDGTIKTCD